MILLLAAGVQHLIVTLPPARTFWGWTIEQWTLMIAVATLIGVGVQISLAGRELDYVKRDLENNTTQFKDFMRRPQLKANQWADFLPSDDGLSRRVYVSVEIWNEGDRPTRDGLVELLVPNHALASPQKNGSAILRTVHGVEYMPYQNGYTQVLYPNSVRRQVSNGFQFGIKTDLTELTVLWRIYDEYGKYPKDEWGKWELQPK